MKERINRLAKGIVDSEQPKIILRPETIEETVRTDASVKREIFIGSDNGLNVKGLVYSSDMRVRIPSDNNAFGGLRSHISYEVDTSFLPAGEEIKGAFQLVTNCGEKEIPYVFHVELPSSGKVLGELNTVEDFLEIAEHDMDTALRLLEYPEFTEAPFMQDVHVRAVYDGLKGHGSRQNFMEEFLVALEAKEPIHLMIDDSRKVYEDLTARTEGYVTIRTDSWGYIYLEFTADGDFLLLPKKSATQADFSEGAFKVPFSILPERLHAGRNYGAIFVHTAGGQTKIPVEVLVSGCGREAEELSFRRGICRYLELCVDWESGAGAQDMMLQEMQKELDLLKITSDKPYLLLFQAHLYLLAGRLDKASLVLDEVRDQVLANHLREKGVYCFFQYLQLQIKEDREQRDSLIRLLQKYCSASENGSRDSILYLMLLRVNESLYENPGTVLISMEQEFKDGCHSPFLYIECLRLLNQDPGLLKGLDRLEVQALHFGTRRGMVGEELACRVAEIARGSKSFRVLCLRILCCAYEKHPMEPILSAICSMLIKGDLKGQDAFIWYEKGIEAGVSLTRLYEYFLYSMPEDYDRLLPREVLLYFSYENELDQNSRSKLYRNILLFCDRNSNIYKAFERSMEQFAMEQLFAGQIDSCLAVLYKKLLYKELIDVPIAKALPAILLSNRLDCHDSAMRFAVVRHEELMSEDVYPLQDGVAYVPLFSDRDVIQFQDTFGNRYMNVRYEKKRVMEDVDELLFCCFESYPAQPMLFVNACYAALEKEDMNQDDVGLLELANEKLRLHPLFRKKLMSAIVQYYKKNADTGVEGERREGVSYLLYLDKDALTREERSGVCETLIGQNYYSEAYDMVCRYGAEGISSKRLLRLCTKMVLQKLFDEDDRLLKLAYQVFEVEKGDSIVLDYLCEHYNGTVDQMYRILLAGLKEHVETYDMEERLVAQMLFTGRTERLDRVFDLYASRKKTNESIVKAYFTVKSIEYFLDGKATEDKVFAYLEGAVNNSVEKDKVPDIYLLALTRYYSTLPELSGEQRELCQSVVDVLVDAGMIFSYFKDLARFIKIPGNILDKEIIEYHGDKEKKPYLRLRILPDEEEYHYEDMRPIYKGIYIREKVLFEGEILEYQILEEKENGQQVVKEGSLSSREVSSRAPGSRFAYLNEMSLSLEVKNEFALREKMVEYLEKDAAVTALFTLQ